ncbi:MAG: thiaminase II [Candidatus Tectomicrobia bacterium]|nr:thiaminase II [Candidatus Tectomicrobia bacterium]
MSESFAEYLRAKGAPIWEAIFAHPFVQEVGKGTLSRDRFLFFVRQDYLYLADFGKVLCMGGVKADSLETLEMFADHAMTVVRVERAFHGGFAKKLGLTPEELVSTERAPGTQAYTRHLLAVAHRGTLGELVAAVLPCYWIYWEVGVRLNRSLPSDEIYAEWIRAYAAEAFEAHVKQQLKLIDRLAQEASKEEKERMTEHFLLSSRYEYLFWDQAYKQQFWPV